MGNLLLQGHDLIALFVNFLLELVDAFLLLLDLPADNALFLFGIVFFLLPGFLLLRNLINLLLNLQHSGMPAHRHKHKTGGRHNGYEGDKNTFFHRPFSS
ncbi:hypothetical protein D3C75_1018100 [compost metagenome]